MNKKQVVWLLIRLAGLWFVWQSIENAIVLANAYLVASRAQRLAIVLSQHFREVLLNAGFE